MKVACVIHSLDGGGAERVVAGLASRLVGRGQSVTLITLDDGSRDRYAVAAGVRRVPLDVMSDSHRLWQRVWATRRRLLAVRRAIRSASPDVVLSFCDRTNLLVLGSVSPAVPASSGQMRWRTGVPVVIAERTDPSQQNLGPIGERLRRRLYPRATRVVALTETSADHLRRLGCRGVDVVPSAVDAPSARSDRRAAADRSRILGVGRLAPEKGFDRLVRAFASIAPELPDWTLRVVGEGPQRGALETLAEKLGVRDRVTFPGWIRPIWDEYRAATLFALPSRYEGFPSALLEAMASGLPCVAVDCESGPRAIIRTGHDGMLVPNTTEALAAGIRRLAEDADLRERYCEPAADVVRRFGWEAMVDRYERVLETAIQETARRSEATAGRPADDLAAGHDPR